MRSRGWGSYEDLGFDLTRNYKMIVSTGLPEVQVLERSPWLCDNRLEWEKGQRSFSRRFLYNPTSS